VLEFAAQPAASSRPPRSRQKYGASRAPPREGARAGCGRAGLVSAARGMGGGYRFSGNPKRVTLLDVISVFEDRRLERAQGAAARAGLDLQRAVDRVLAEIDETAKATFGSITLETLLRFAAR
jgi:DNA-binding IscR family transcriptional regulator